jgi:glutamyl-tRNA synthetase
VSAEPTGRYAPSPTGDVHLGNARTALLAWLWARAAGGRFLLRLEDLDRARVRDGSADGQLADLAALGLEWDGEVVAQSQRSALYDAALRRLDDAGAVYPCFCSRADIRAAASAPHGPEGHRYPGTCRTLPADVAAARLAAGEEAALRFRADGTVTFVDAVQGEISEELSEAGDFVVRRRDGVVAYQLAVVVDDAAQDVDQVLRGDDLLPSTGRQIALRSALGLWPGPRYAHVPLLLGADGARLAKRHGAIGVRELLDGGLSPEGLVGWLAHTAGLWPNAPATPAQLLDGFSLDRLGRQPYTVSRPPAV